MIILCVTTIILFAYDYQYRTKSKCAENLVAGREPSFVSFADNKLFTNKVDMGSNQYFYFLESGLFGICVEKDLENIVKVR